MQPWLTGREHMYLASCKQTQRAAPWMILMLVFVSISSCLKTRSNKQNGDDDVLPHFASSHHLLPSTNCYSHILFASFHSFKNHKQNFEALPFLLLLVVEAGMQLSLLPLLLLLLQHSHSLSTLPVVACKPRFKHHHQMLVQHATGTYFGVSLTLLFFFNTLPSLGPLHCQKLKCLM
jgi:hypothetical protein